ncbi:hypothetical protein BG015_000132 [Linnemannia schmuckeri]|uniref:FAD-binding domain-containing protein n=1 Tax=Linnemannia schmuckeri TaxID=64567 RepID=A0A9P5RTZ6_9FUNG|nr:hypothetical protein BG015_000132 [Linnemannia schmuckeri]
MSATVATPRPTVLIVGAGLGGLVLGALLERCNIPYAIFERASTVKPLGSAMSLAGQMIYLFRQLGIDEKFVAMSKYSRFANGRRDDGTPLPPSDFIAMEEYGGSPSYIVARPLLYNLLLGLIPPKKIHFGKRILTITEEDDKVKIQAADSSVYEGDILVGADGAYSAVRQQLYNRLKKRGELPKSDQEDLPFSCTCLVGQTDPLDLEEYPELKNPKEPFVTTFARDIPFTWTIFSTKQNTLCFMVLEHLSKKTSKAAQEQRFRNTDNSEWGPHAAQAMCDETRDFSISFGGGKKTLGDIYDKTPKERIVKVMLEEKVFKTWYSGRTVLLGDACHKVNPSAGVGAITAMHDAIALANLIYALPANTTEEITKTFQEYHAERYPPAIEAYNNSLLMSKLLKGGITGAIASFVKNNMPNWLWRLAVKGLIMNRLQAGFLKHVEDKGTVPPNVSPSTEKARALYNKRMGVAAAV